MEIPMIIRIFTWIIIVGAGIGALYAFESARVPCQRALTYSIGQFDTRFGITQDEFRAAIVRAEAPWEAAFGRDLFQYDPEALFPVNLVFDERQARTIDGQRLESELENVQSKQATIKGRYDANVAALTKRRAEYDARAKAFEKALDRYNARVAEWNDSDRSDEDELDWLRDEERRLARDQREIETLRQKVNALVAEVNRYAKEDEKVVERYNTQVETFTETYGTGDVFDQGVYEGTSIDIYQFDDREHLEMVLVHELGHALGIEHVGNPKSIMYPVMGEQDVKNLQLSNEDREALNDVCAVTAWDLLLRDTRTAWSLLST